MSAARYNLVIDQGSDFAVSMVIKEDGTVKDLSGFSARAQMRSSKNTTAVAATFTCTVESPPTAGTIVMSLNAATSSALTAGTFYYDMEVYTASDATVTRLIQGTVEVTREITR
jgi:hypothetical protein